MHTSANCNALKEDRDSRPQPKNASAAHLESPKLLGPAVVGPELSAVSRYLLGMAVVVDCKEEDVLFHHPQKHASHESCRDLRLDSGGCGSHASLGSLLEVC